MVASHCVRAWLDVCSRHSSGKAQPLREGQGGKACLWTGQRREGSHPPRHHIYLKYIASLASV